MKIEVVGLGLIGGSFAKSIKKNTDYTCFGVDIDKETIKKAIAQGAIDKEATNLGEADLTIICLYPNKTIEFLLENKDKFKKNSIVIDTCGVKSEIVSAVAEELHKAGVKFVGTHPMAGREFSGYDYSKADLFDNASLIVTPSSFNNEEIIELVRNFALEIGFKTTVVSTPEEHDRIIAYTSQLAHIVSSAYVKSPEAQQQRGFSAGSFQDLTRVAKLNHHMWTPLFLMNKENLVREIGVIIGNLEDYRRAIAEGNAMELSKMLLEGTIAKEAL